MHYLRTENKKSGLLTHFPPTSHTAHCRIMSDITFHQQNIIYEPNLMQFESIILYTGDCDLMEEMAEDLRQKVEAVMSSIRKHNKSKELVTKTKIFPYETPDFSPESDNIRGAALDLENDQWFCFSGGGSFRR